MQRAVPNCAAMRVADATAEAVFGCASAAAHCGAREPLTSAFNTVKLQTRKTTEERRKHRHQPHIRKTNSGAGARPRRSFYEA